MALTKDKGMKKAKPSKTKLKTKASGIIMVIGLKIMLISTILAK